MRQLISGRSTPARRVLLAKMVLAAAQGRENTDIAAEWGCTRRTVGTWRNRFAQSGLQGIEQDAPRPGRTAFVRARKAAEMIRQTIQETPPPQFSCGRWRPSKAAQSSTRTMAAAVRVSETTVRRVCRDHGLQPHRIKTFKVSNDPRFAEKLANAVGLDFDPEHLGVHAATQASGRDQVPQADRRPDAAGP